MIDCHTMSESENVPVVKNDLSMSCQYRDESSISVYSLDKCAMVTSTTKSASYLNATFFDCDFQSRLPTLNKPQNFSKDGSQFPLHKANILLKSPQATRMCKWISQFHFSCGCRLPRNSNHRICPMQCRSREGISYVCQKERGGDGRIRLVDFTCAQHLEVPCDGPRCFRYVQELIDSGAFRDLFDESTAHANGDDDSRILLLLTHWYEQGLLVEVPRDWFPSPFS